MFLKFFLTLCKDLGKGMGMFDCHGHAVLRLRANDPFFERPHTAQAGTTTSPTTIGSTMISLWFKSREDSIPFDFVRVVLDGSLTGWQQSYLGKVSESVSGCICVTRYRIVMCCNIMYLNIRAIYQRWRRNDSVLPSIIKTILNENQGKCQECLQLFSWHATKTYLTYSQLQFLSFFIDEWNLSFELCFFAADLPHYNAMFNSLCWLDIYVEINRRKYYKGYIKWIFANEISIP